MASFVSKKRNISRRKSADGAGDVEIDKELLTMFRGWHAKATGAFVVEADSQPRSATTYAH